MGLICYPNAAMLSTSPRSSLLASLLSILVLPLAAQFGPGGTVVQVDDCGAFVRLCSDYTEAEYDNTQTFIDGVRYDRPFDACDAEVSTSYDVARLPEDGFGGSGAYEITDWQIDGVSYTTTVADVFALEAWMKDTDPAGAWTIDIQDIVIRGGAEGVTYSAIEVTQLNTNDMVTLAADVESVGGTAAYTIGVGEHAVEVRDGGSVIESFTVTVSCPQAPAAQYVAIAVGADTTIAVSLDRMAQAIDPNSVQLTPELAFVRIELAEDDRLRITALAEGLDSTTVRYCDGAGNCDEARFTIEASLAGGITPVTVYDTVGVPGAVRTYCLDTTQLPGIITTVTDLCADPPREFVEFTYSENTHCLKYRGLLAGGTDSTCIVLCDDLGFCDTTKVIVTTLEPEPLPSRELEFTIDKGTSDMTVLDFSDFDQRPTSLDNECPTESGDLVFFSLDPPALEVTFEGLEVGTERACVLAKAANGQTQRFDITVNVVTRTPGTDTIRIVLGQMRNWCFGDYELVTAPVSLTDECMAADVKATYVPTDDVTCLDFTGEELGFQEFCMTLCDDGGRCDLVNLLVEVYEAGSINPPVANDDLVNVPRTGIADFDVFANDVSEPGITSARIVSRPNGGTATLSPDGLLTYTRSADIPCEDDQLVYEICNEGGCDRATVTLDLDCAGIDGRDPIVIGRAVSPNDDGVQDAWEILNIEAYPDNEVKVYNRWGSRVFTTSGYDNTWAGTFQDGKPLPDGTYFYVITIEEGAAQAGYLELRR